MQSYYEMTFLKDLFSELSSENIKYSVLRNSESLPDSLGNSDLDIFISLSDSESFFLLLKDLSYKFDGRIVSYIPDNFCPRICLLGITPKPWGIMLDVHLESIFYNSVLILNKGAILDYTFVNSKNISFLDSKIDSIICLLKESLNNGKFSVKYYSKLKNCIPSDEILNELFPSNSIKSVGDVLNRILDSEYTIESSKSFSLELADIYPRNYFVAGFKRIKKINRIFSQPGYSVSFLGTDGSGKSTLIKEISNPLSQAFHNSVFYEHSRPNHLPSLARLMGKKDDFSSPISDPHGSSSSGFVGSLLRWSYYLLDYTFGFYLKVWPKKAFRSCIWIFDRYYYDYLIDPKRSRINLPNWILKFGHFFIPEPDLIFCLGTDPVVIHERKPELSLREVERQVSELKKFAKNHPRAVWIDTGVSIEKSSNEVLGHLIRYMGKRFQNFNFK